MNHSLLREIRRYKQWQEQYDNLWQIRKEYSRSVHKLYSGNTWSVFQQKLRELNGTYATGYGKDIGQTRLNQLGQKIRNYRKLLEPLEQAVFDLDSQDYTDDHQTTFD